MKNKEVVELYERINKLGGLKGLKLAYAVNKNKKALKKEIDNLMEVAKPSKEWEEFQGKHIKNGQFDIESARSESPKLVRDRENQIKEYNALLEDEADVKLHKIKESLIPEDVTVEQYEILSFLL